MWPPVVLALLLLAIPHAQAARPYTVETSDPLLEPWRWQKFSHLSGKGLECMLGDPRGHLWFGTASGVYRYDGLEWSHYPVPKDLLGSAIYHLALTREGVLYAGSDRSLSRMQDETWQRVFPIDDETFCPITGIATTGSKGIWASTPFGILHVDPTGSLDHLHVLVHLVGTNLPQVHPLVFVVRDDAPELRATLIVPH